MYKKHCANLNQINYSIKELENSIKYAIKTENDMAITTYTNIHSFLTGAWIEVSLYKLINENKFDESDREFILTNKSLNLEDKWINTLNYAFSKAFSINNTSFEIPDNALPRTQKHRFDDLKDFIKNDFNLAINIRNKIAHGQWEYTFNNKMTEINPDTQSMILDNNYFRSKLRLETIKVVIKMIHDISVSPRTSDRDFDAHFSKIEDIKIRYNDESYHKNNNEMREKYNRAEYWKKKNSS